MTVQQLIENIHSSNRLLGLPPNETMELKITWSGKTVSNYFCDTSNLVNASTFLVQSDDNS